MKKKKLVLARHPNVKVKSLVDKTYEEIKFCLLCKTQNMNEHAIIRNNIYNQLQSDVMLLILTSFPMACPDVFHIYMTRIYHKLLKLLKNKTLYFYIYLDTYIYR